MDPIQILLLIVLSLSTLFLTVIGIQLIFVLIETRKTLKQINKVIKGFESLGVGLHHGINEAVGFANGFKTIMKMIEVIGHKKNESQK
jgi:hypothetical protein